MSKYLDALNNLASGKSKDKLEDYFTLKEAVLFGEQYIGLNRVWNKYWKEEGKHNITTKSLEMVFSIFEELKNAHSEGFKYKKDTDRIIIEELREKIGCTISESLIDDMIFNLCVADMNSLKGE